MTSSSSFRLARWEIRRLVAERTGVALLLVWCALLAIAAGQGLRQTRAQHAEIDSTLALDRTTWATKRAKLIELESGRAKPETYGDPRNPVHAVFGGGGDRPIVLVPAPLAALAAGPGDLAPVVKRSGLITKLHLPPESIDNPANRLAGPLDLNFVVGALLPLFVLVLAFDVLAREREARIWPLLASQPIATGCIVAARLGVHFTALLAPLVLAAGIAVLGSQADGAALVPALGELALWLVLAALYLLFWQCLAAWVNFRAWSAATNALALGGAWLATVLLLPSLVQAVVQHVVPPPDRRAFILQLRETETDLFKRADELRDAYYAKNPALRPTGALNEYDTYFLQNLWPRALAADAALAPALTTLTNARTAQSVWWRRLAWVSPTLAFRLATEQLAGATPIQQSVLTAEAHNFQQRWRAHFGAKVAAKRPLVLTDYDTKPEPAVVRLSLGARFTAALPALLAVGLTALASLALLHHPVRPILFESPKS